MVRNTRRSAQQQTDRDILQIGILLLDDFTLTAFAAFLDAIRLAADKGDQSRQQDCAWTVMTIHGEAVRASCGVTVRPHDGPRDPSSFHYLTVVGGLLNNRHHRDPHLSKYLTLAANKRIPLIGLGTGSFALAHAGLMNGRRCCVSWYHLAEFQEAFPELEVVADQLFVIEHDRITCAGGTGVVDVAAHLLEQHCGASAAIKALRLLHVEHLRAPTTPQWQSSTDSVVGDAKVRRAVLMMEQNLTNPLPISKIAQSLQLSPRQLQRKFRRATGKSLMDFSRELRLEYAREQILRTKRPITNIAYECGFSDSSHFARCYRRCFGESPSATRRQV
ncbi:MAG: AraC family transcriptional regulator [marine bacterium B5-7]|nr:MAG: AraC family transcriptional regulator [marine bacterium B5-7]